VPVGIVYITDGAASHPAHPHHGPADIAQLRQAEAVRAMQQLRVGPTSLYFLGAPDGTLSHLDAAETEKFASRLAVLLAPLQPTELFIPCQDDSSSEHSAAYQLTLRALRIAGLSPRLYEYPVWARWRPQHLLRLGLRSHRVWRLFFPQNVLRKRAALACYQSQTQPTPPWPQPVLPSGFAACFESAEEFFFER
jgi:LmbE family N-acetylglucosaminyl deacetylase